jgi:hypothetical protein
MHKLIFSLFFAAAVAASAQRLSFGVKAGAPVTEASPYEHAPYSTVDTGRWTVGPTVELRLIAGLSFESDALYRGFRRQDSTAFAVIPAGMSMISGPAIFATSRQDAKEWDFPLLLKYRFPAGALRPFLDAGAVFAHQTSDFTSTSQCLGTPDQCAAPSFAPFSFGRSSYSGTVNRRGPAGGVGVEFKYHRIRIAPEVRYMHLNRPATNEVTVLVGFTF